MAGREVTDEEADRRRRAGRWLRRERDDRRLDQAAVAQHVGVGQQTYSKWELGQAPISSDYVEPIAELFEMDEPIVWRGLELRLPAQFRDDRTTAAWSLRQLTDEEAIARAEERLPEVMEKFSGGKTRKATPLPPGPVRRRTRDTRRGEKRRDADPGRESAV